MPRTLKEIYLAKSVKNLQDIANISNISPNMEPRQLDKLAGTIFDTARKEQENGDEEKAYILLTKYFKIAKYLAFDCVMGRAVKELKALERSLEARYQSKADEEMAKHPNQRIEPTEPRIPECSTCLEPRTRTFLLVPCGHATFCQECAERFHEDKRCPTCRAEITGKIRVFQ